MLRCTEIGVNALRMHRAIGNSRRCAVTDQFVQKALCDKFRVLLIGKFLLCHECIGVEPFEKIGGIGRNNLRLRIMDMRIDEAGQDEMWPMIGNLYVAACFSAYLGIISEARDAAIFDKHSTIFDIAIGLTVIQTLRFVTKGQHAATDEKFAHYYFAPAVADSYQEASSLRSSLLTPVTLAGGMAWDRPACK